MTQTPAGPKQLAAELVELDRLIIAIHNVVNAT
jgi:hypothetical protein